MGVAIDQWVEIPNTLMSAVPPQVVRVGWNAAGRMDAWNGYVARGTDIYSVRQGGHTDYGGNEVLKFDLGSNAPRWSLVRGASPETAICTTCSNSRYADGEPAASHGYAMHRYIRQRDWMISIGNTAVTANGGSPAECIVYDVATNRFLPTGTMPDAMPMAIADHAVWDDPVTGDVFHNYARTVNRWNQATNTWSFNVATMQNNYGIPAVGCTDTTRRRALILGGLPPAREPYVFDIASSTATQITCSGDQTIVTAAGHFGMVYSPVTDRFYAMTGLGGGQGLYEINPVTFRITPKITTGATSMLPIAEGGTGVYTRFLSVQSLGGIVYFPRYQSNAWFLRLH